MDERIGIGARIMELLQVSGGDTGSTVLAKSAPSGAGMLGMQDPNKSRLLADEGYRKNVVIYSCINIIARTASEPDLVVARVNSDGEREPITPGNGDSPGRNLQALLDHPNREQSQYDWLERSLIELGYSGNSITHKRPSRGGATRAAPGGPVAELWQLTPYRTELRADKENLPAFYKFPTDNPGAAEDVPAEEIIHIKRHDPTNEHWGLSPLVVAARAGDLDNMATDYLRQMFQNLGEPSALLIFKEIKTRAQHQRTRDIWKDNYGLDARGMHKIGTLDSAVEWQEVGSRPNDMALDGVFTHSETRICGAFGVPPILVAVASGLKHAGSLGGGNYREAIRDFWTETMVPMYTRYGDKLTHRLAKDFADDLVIFFDLSHIGALQDDRKDLREFALKAWKDSLLPRNRSLELAQVELVEEPARGNAYFVDENTQPVPIGLSADFQSFGIKQLLRLHAPELIIPHGEGDLIAREISEALKLPPKVWQTVDRLADNAAPAFSAAFISAVNNAQSQISLMALEQALKNNDIPTAEAILARAWEDQLADFRSDFRDPLTALYIKGGDVGDGQLKRAIVKFETAPSETLNISEDEAAQFIEAQLGNMIAEISEGTRRAIRAAVTQLAEGVSLRTVAKQIRDRVGLTTRMVESLEKKRAEGLSESALEKLTRKLIRRRAVNIALNEGRIAASEGQEFVWKKATEEGVLKGEARQFWITAGDDDVCTICAPMDGQERRIGETFTTGNNRQVRLPPEPHNRCRCARGLKLER